MQLGFARGLLVIAALVVGLQFNPVAFSAVLAADGNESPIRASNAVVVDATTGEVLYEQGMTEQVAPASLTKIFTTIVALESGPLEAEMFVDEYDLIGEASVGLRAGETVTMETLLHGLMLTSGNDAAMTVARELANLPGDTPQESVSRFVDRVNATTERLGLTNTTLRNPHGLDQSGHLSTAEDIAAMTMYGLDNPVFEQLISTPYYAYNGRELYNMNQFLDAYSGLIGGKTGVTNKAGYCLLQVAERDGNTVIVVLLGSDRESWYADAEYLLDLGFDELAANPTDDSRPVIGPAGITSLNVPEVTGSASVGGNFTVDRLSDHEAVVRPSSPLSSEESMSWRWPLVSVAMMGVALVLVLNFPAIVGMGALAFDRGSRLRLNGHSMPALPSLNTVRSLFQQPARARSRRRLTQDVSGDRWLPGVSSESREHRSSTRQGDDWMNQTHYPDTVSVSPARSRAESAIKFAMQGRYHIATEEFRSALERDPEVDIASCPGFWRMQPMGYIAAAKAYLLNDQKDDARRLLSIVQMAFKSNNELVGLFGRAIKQLDG